MLVFYRLLFTFMITALAACTMPLRTGYDRSIGGYKPLPKAETVKATATPNADLLDSNSDADIDSDLKTTPSQTVDANTEQKQVKQDNQSWESFIQPWLGTRYKFGGSSRSGTDCSGYIMQIYKTKLNIALPHNAAAMYKMGAAVPEKKLKEGDLVFFGNVWGINHVGVYLHGGRFTHASSSQGVTITPMEMDYWKSRYKGARRLVQ